MLFTYLQQAQQVGAEQKKSRNIQKRKPQPIRLGPMRRSSGDLKPCSPIPTNVMMSPTGYSTIIVASLIVVVQ